MGSLYYSRHFALLAGVVLLLAVGNRIGPVPGAVASFGMYAALHASMVAVSLRAWQPLNRKLLFVACSAAFSMLSVTFSYYLSRRLGRISGLPASALLLASSSALGAVSYALLLRRIVGPFPGPAVAAVALGCTLATSAVLLSGVYLRGGVLWFAAAWWFAFSFGLWWQDRGRAPA